MTSAIPAVNSSVLPGQRLCAINTTNNNNTNNRNTGNNKCGLGTYEHQGFIHASLAGTLSVKRVSAEASGGGGSGGSGAGGGGGTNGLSVLEISVLREKPAIVPSVGSVVICRVNCITSRFAKCSLISVDGVSAPDSFKGMIRKEDIRATEKDKVEVHKSFQPRDIVVAKVISLGDASAYLLTTAENELGVIVAYPSSSTTTETPMMPISWCEVFCPSTGVKELRKVAKPQPQYLTVRE